MILSNLLHRSIFAVLFIMQVSFMYSQQHLTYCGVSINGIPQTAIASLVQKGFAKKSNSNYYSAFMGKKYEVSFIKAGDGKNIYAVKEKFSEIKSLNEAETLREEYINKRIYNNKNYNKVVLKNSYQVSSHNYNYPSPYEDTIFAVYGKDGSLLGEISVYVSDFYGDILFIVTYYDNRNTKSFQYADDYPFSIENKNLKWISLSSQSSYTKLDIAEGNCVYYLRLKNNSVQYPYIYIRAEKDDYDYMQCFLSKCNNKQLLGELLTTYVNTVVKEIKSPTDTKYTADLFYSICEGYIKKIEEKNLADNIKKKKNRLLMETLFGRFFTKEELDLMDEHLPAGYLKEILGGAGGYSNSSDDYIRQAERATKRELNE